MTRWPPDPLVFVAVGCALVAIAALVAAPAPFLRRRLQFDRGDLVALCVAFGTLAAGGIVAAAIALDRQDEAARRYVTDRTLDRDEVARIAQRQARLERPTPAELRARIRRLLQSLQHASPRDRAAIRRLLRTLGVTRPRPPRVQQRTRRQDSTPPPANVHPAPPSRRRPPGRPGAGGPVGGSGGGSQPPPERPPPAPRPPVTITTPPDVTTPPAGPVPPVQTPLPHPALCTPIAELNAGCDGRPLGR